MTETYSNVYGFYSNILQMQVLYFNLIFSILLQNQQKFAQFGYSEKTANLENKNDKSMTVLVYVIICSFLCIMID